MLITHEQARTLIQLKMDRTLNAQESAALSAHLQTCRDCATYASEVREVADLLSPLMKRQWGAQSVPLSVSALMGRHEKPKSINFLTMRTAVMSLVMMLMFFSLWQFVVSGPTPSGQFTASIPPVPTPSSLTAPSASIQLTYESCEITPYTVQANDTLASIASQFSISEDAIMKFNSLETNEVRPRMELLIPVCPSTPTSTLHPATFTTTWTPVLNYAPSTPDG